MWQSMKEKNKKSIDPLMYHHSNKEYKDLENYL
jgi:hypothetical protein